jgi:diaminohydroxyphosphoribosylaminopyrimidine deaminase / 5-amino-6-(5-phosphoribosylamino)uracil reductase
VPPAADVGAALARAHLDAAFALGERARGRTSPNPFVGCRLVGADGVVVGEGWTQPPPGPHAEVVALAAAGAAAAGATAYVTLEPCDHTGRTPPCSRALAGAGVARVVAALADPHPAAGGGAATLRAAGVEVVLDADAERARGVHEVFLHGLATGRPFVVAKAAASMDGYLADAGGRSRWLTGVGTRRLAHRLRAEVDAVVVGSGTALADDPALTVRLDGYDGPQPLRVVLDRRGRLRDADLRLLRPGPVETVVLDAPDPAAALAELWHLGVRSALVEGGAGVLGAFVAADLVDRYELHLAGVLLGAGLPVLDAAFTLGTAPRLRPVAAALSDDDVVVTAYPHRP